MTKSLASDALETLLAELESQILEESGEEFLADSLAETTETAAYISSRSAAKSAEPLGKPWQRRGLPRSASGRRRLLSELVASRKALPQRIAVAFSRGELREEEIPNLLRDILKEEGDASED